MKSVRNRCLNELNSLAHREELQFSSFSLPENAEFLERGEIPTPMDSLDSYLAALGTIIHRYGHNVEGIAMCVPGIIDSVQGVCITGGNLRYVKDLPLATLLEERYGLRVSLEMTPAVRP